MSFQKFEEKLDVFTFMVDEHVRESAFFHCTALHQLNVNLVGLYSEISHLYISLIYSDFMLS